jgi:Right handed beta helix region
MTTFRRVLAPLLVSLLVVLVAPLGARAHTERPAEFPDGTGSVPKYRTTGPLLLVCNKTTSKAIRRQSGTWRAMNVKLAKRCRRNGYSTIQGAINAVRTPGSRIKILPGTYTESAHRNPPACEKALGPRPRSYKEQFRCPHAENLISVMGDMHPDDNKRLCDAPVCNLQIEGTGRRAEDVVIKGGFNKKGEWAKLNGIRGDRSDGLYLKNFTVELFEFNSIYILETDGFVIDDVTTRYNDEYGYLTFAVDHGVYKNCNTYGNGDSGIYPGSASDLNSESDETGPLKRWAVEIFNCRSHHNALGYSGTAGNSVYVHNNRFYKNQTGLATDSIYPNHPGLPQDHGWYENNLIYSNNVNYTEKYVQSGKCDKKPAKIGYERGVVCTVTPAPVGTGMVIAGGNHNYTHGNKVWDNWRTGFMLLAVPAAIRNEMDPSKQFDTSHFNFYTGNTMGITKSGKELPNGFDFWWDDQGEGNCWQDNKPIEGREITSNTMYPGGLPNCDDGGSLPLPNNPYKSASVASCSLYDRNDPFFRDPPACDFFDTPPRPE